MTSASPIAKTAETIHNSAGRVDSARASAATTGAAAGYYQTFQSAPQQQAPQPQVAYQQQAPAPIVIQQAPPQVIYQQSPPQVVYQPAPIYVRPRPVTHHRRRRIIIWLLSIRAGLLKNFVFVEKGCLAPAFFYLLRVVVRL